MTEPTSLDVLEDVARREHDAQERRADSLDGQAGLVLGFSGLLVSVGVDVVWPPLALAGRVLAAAAGLSALRAFSSRARDGLALRALRREPRPPEEMRWRVVDVYLTALDRMEIATSRKVAYLRRAVRLLTLAVAVTAVGLPSRRSRRGRGEPMTAEPARDDWRPYEPQPELLLTYGTRKLDREFRRRIAEEAAIDEALAAERAAAAREAAREAASQAAREAAPGAPATEVPTGG